MSLRILSIQVLKNASHQHPGSQKLLLNQFFSVRIGAPSDVSLISTEHLQPA
ncbi:Unknown protein sequence [Pseudomonas syringae pv. maculicola]|nr:Unknown protein sequence [Pseudomonas syringae pv. maculicola]